ncbi:MAG: type 4a pilus biogenesis protein PilO [Candidatus Levybacteria bacterium]|nr:type 4a pilus biogenesis protein PilO [Candidatus Levybacteria bacterium]
MNKTNKIKETFKNIKISKYFELLPDFKNENAQKFTSLVLTIVALSFLGLFAVGPTLSTIARLNKELADNKRTDQELQQKISNLSILQQKYNSLLGDLPVILSSIPSNSEVPLFLAQIQSLARSSGIEITSLQSFQIEAVSPKNTNKKYSSYSFTFSANGSYENISKFISSLLTMQRIVLIDNLSISKSNQTGLLQTTLRGVVYFKE